MILFCVPKTTNKQTLNKSSYVRNEFLPLHFFNNRKRKFIMLIDKLPVARSFLFLLNIILRSLKVFC